MKKQKNKVVKGWAEVLWRFRPVKVIRSESVLEHDDYFYVDGAQLPLQEYNGPFDIYEALRDDMVAKKYGFPRAMRRYDIINLCTATPRGVTSFLMVDLHKDEILRYPDALIIGLNGFPLSMLRLRTPFPSFRK